MGRKANLGKKTGRITVRSPEKPLKMHEIWHCNSFLPRLQPAKYRLPVLLLFLRNGGSASADISSAKSVKSLEMQGSFRDLRYLGGASSYGKRKPCCLSNMICCRKKRATALFCRNIFPNLHMSKFTNALF